MPKFNDRGAIPPLILISVIAIVGFIVASSIFSFKNKLFSELFPRLFSKASQTQITFIDDQGNVITSITTPTVKVKIHSDYPANPQIATTSASPSSSPSPSITTSPSSTASSSASTVPIYTKDIVLSEASDFSQNPLTFPYLLCTSSGQTTCVDPNFGDFITSFTFSDTSFGTKVLCVKFNLTDNQTPSTCATIDLIDQNSQNPTPTPSLQPSPSDAPYIYYPTQAPVFESNFQATPSITPATPQPTPTIIPTSKPSNFFSNINNQVIIEQNSYQPEFVRPSEKPESNPGVIIKQINTLRSRVELLLSNLFKVQLQPILKIFK